MVSRLSRRDGMQSAFPSLTRVLESTLVSREAPVRLPWSWGRRFAARVMLSGRF